MIIILWLSLSALVAYFANQKGHNPVVFFFIALFLSPIIGGIFALFSDDLSDEIKFNNGSLKKCMFCAETINSEAIKCKHCGEIQSNIKPENLNEKDLNALIDRIEHKK